MDRQAKQAALQARLRDLLQSIQQYQAILKQAETEATKIVGKLELMAEEEAEVSRVPDGDRAGSGRADGTPAVRPARAKGAPD
jgi:hypothetical protein